MWKPSCIPLTSVAHPRMPTAAVCRKAVGSVVRLPMPPSQNPTIHMCSLSSVNTAMPCGSCTAPSPCCEASPSGTWLNVTKDQQKCQLWAGGPAAWQAIKACTEAAAAAAHAIKLQALIAHARSTDSRHSRLTAVPLQASATVCLPQQRMHARRRTHYAADQVCPVVVRQPV